jgi:hypothetical protein
VSVRAFCIYIGAFAAYASLFTFWVGYACTSREMMWGSILIEPFALTVMFLAFFTQRIKG